MIQLRILSPIFLLVSAACLGLGGAQESSKRSLDVADWSRWRTIEGERLSLSGERILYQLAAPDGTDGELRARATAEGEADVVVERGFAGSFDAAAKWLVCRVEPAYVDKCAAELEDTKKDELPKPGLAVVELESAERRDIERVASFALPKRGGSHVAWLHEKELPKKKDKGAAKKEGGSKAEAEEKPSEEEEEEGLSRVEKKKRKAKAEGTKLTLLELSTDAERTIENVQHYVFDEMGTHLAYVVSTKKADTDGLFWLDLTTAQAEPIQLLVGTGNYGKPVFSKDGSQLACLSNHADYTSDAPHWSLYYWGEGPHAPAQMIGDTTAGMPSAWSVSEHRAPWYSESGGRLFVGTAPSPALDPEPKPKSETVVVDVWNWRDSRLQPQQLVELEEDRKRSYLAVWQRDANRLVQLGSERVPDVRVPRKGECARALGTSNLPYERSRSWDVPGYQDVWAIEVDSGQARQLLTRQRGRYQMSPGGAYVYGWDGAARSWLTVDASGGRPKHISAGLPHAIDDHRHDTPQVTRSYGSAGWTDGDERFVIYDRYDLWSLDPSGRSEARCLTHGLGRARTTELRWRDVDVDEEWMGAGPWLLSAMHVDTRDAGFWMLDDPAAAQRSGSSIASTASAVDTTSAAADDSSPRELLSGAWRFSNPVRAEEGGLLRLTRENYQDFPDLWVAEQDMQGLRRISDANPQRAEYYWGSAERFEWTSTAGEELDGTLYKPEGFDPQQAYPLLVYFYERSADRLHSHHTPIPSRSTIRFPYYNSRGYIVFVPDIHYEIGYPGRSAEHAVLPGIAKLIDQGIADPERIGVQGHSWGGYQIAWLITQTNLFAAAVSGAPVSNMTSAYGGIRWASGLSRMFQYEKSQSRLGGTLWDASQRYVENSPLFFADNVETPVVILHNDEDGAVPWYQGIELFVALRRLDKPSWLLNYNGEQHGLTQYANKRDYAIRMAQFFDHYLLGAPAPVWLQSGVDALDKGRTLGLEFEDTP
ncbi:MAG: dipeptidyl aminopeptidase/acylaminoacyl peptidase [Planctomycetota bacterium]|jgi:dipeptidyl aminopeptidase/acylaminoacyl peptidase